jgi:hypothetical protein
MAPVAPGSVVVGAMTLRPPTVLIADFLLDRACQLLAPRRD